jgi:MFS family permease
MGSFLGKLQGHAPSDNATPLPALKVTMVSFVMAANEFSLVSLYPTLPFMVASFFPELPVEQLGRRAGILGSMFNFGQLFGSLGVGSSRRSVRPPTHHADWPARHRVGDVSLCVCRLV